jgi:peptidoglycan/xylan/chitin deacetylase (PgdA/CDA1 family)
MRNKTLLFQFIFLFLLSSLWGKVNFQDLDLAGDDSDRLLFRAVSSGGGSPGQEALFLADPAGGVLRQLTAFPEGMELVENGRTLHIRNAFGALRVPAAGGLPASVPGFPSFASGSAAFGGNAAAVSPDGQWILYIEPVSAAYGRLIMLHAVTGEKTVIAAGVELPGGAFSASWSPDSRVFVYVRGGKLYYYTLNQSAVSRTSPPAGDRYGDFYIDEKFRLIGSGTEKSVSWGRDGDFFYIRGSTVYRVRSAELFARALYADFLEIGAVAGKIPFEFDPAFDWFRIAPDARSLLLAKGGSNLFYIPLDFDDYNGSGNLSLPYLAAPRSSLTVNVLWSAGGIVTVLASSPGDAEVSAWRLTSAGGVTSFTPLPVSPGKMPPNAAASANGSLSPDGTRVLFWGKTGVSLWDYINWKPLVLVSPRPGFSCVWISNEEFIAGDEDLIERIRLSSTGGGVSIAGRSLVCLSRAVRFGFEDKGSRIFAQSGGRWYAAAGENPWTEFASPVLKAASQVSPRRRVYLEKQPAGLYENLPMVRNTASSGTVCLLPQLVNAGSGVRAVTAEEELFSGGVFSHGSRSGPRELSLCFDLYDDAEGLPEALDALARFGFKATFFLGGEFIRRYPSAAAAIAAAGHETASLFFAPIDFSDSRYLIGEDFVSLGLARNEDEFFNASGGELALLWHPPWYAASPDLAAAASKAGYITVGRDVDPLDWVGREDEKRFGLPQYSAADMIDRIAEAKKPGSIIPIRLGLLPGGRSDYLFNRLDVLFSALAREGWSIVPVSVLIEHSK